MTRRKRAIDGSGISRESSPPPRDVVEDASRRRRRLLACAPNATLRHLDHRPPQDGDLRLDRRPDRHRDDRRLGRRRLHRRIQAAGLRLQGSLRPAGKQVPGAVGETAQIVYKADSGVESPAGEEEDGRRLRRRSKSSLTSAKSPVPTRKAAPRRSPTTARSPTRRSSSTSPTTSSTKTRRGKSSRSPRAPAATASKVQLGGKPIQEAEQEEGGDSSFAIGLLAAVIILLLTFGSVVAMGLPIITALFALGVGLSLVTVGTHVFNTANFAPSWRR